MSVYLGKLPVESLANIVLNGLNSHKEFENLKAANFSGWDDKSIESGVQAVFRFTCAYIVLPRLASLSCSYNAAMGLSHLIIGLGERVKLLEKDAKPEDWKRIEKNVLKGISHLLTGVYDFALAIIFSQKYLGLAGALAFAAVPATAYFYHQIIIKRPEVQESNLAEVFKETKEVVVNAAEKALNIVEPPPKPEEPKPVVQESCPYLVETCKIYIVAQYLTQKILPKIEANPEVPTPPPVPGLTIRALREMSGYIWTPNQ
jgi:hypothetical protein